MLNDPQGMDTAIVGMVRSPTRIRRSVLRVVFVLAVLVLGAPGCSGSESTEQTEAQLSNARGQYEAGQFEKSELELAKILKDAPDDPAALSTMALVQAAQGKNKEAVAQYLKLVKLNPADHASWYRMALLERVLGLPDKTAQHLEKALDQDPGNPSYTDELARTSMSLGRYKEAALLWGGLLKNDSLPDESRKELLVLQAQAYQAAKDYPKAKKAYKAALKLYPDDKALKAIVKSFD